MSIQGLAPLSVASVIIGFISFAFTIATFLRVIWGNLQTIMSAPQEIEDALGSLKQALYEERTHLKIIRRRCRSDYEEGPFRVLNETLKHMIRSFKRIEEPFLVNPNPNPAHGSNGYSKHGNGGAGSPTARRRNSKLEEDRLEPDDYYNTRYKRVSLRMRFMWLSHQEDVANLSKKLEVLQTRRIARQVTTVAADLKFVTMTVMDIEDQMRRDGGRAGRDLGMRG